ncbi:MAG: NAD(P)H-dependent oxidoreductase [Patescibacteria group bacterium]|nr:NAD(P)H-dependent oxidoreductase [Patescibacteria group bacterium]MDE1966379.1 NAD(P)H-dependent oxidoreductase [Patescibacteria group bacterium]
MKFLAISGSLRKGSYNSALLRAVKALAPAEHSVELVSAEEVRALPLFDQDLEASAYPESATALKARIREADAVIVSTPEFNRSIPGALKNLLDWSTRPYGDNPWAGKPVYVMGASSGQISAALAQYDLKKILLYFNARVMGQPEFYMGPAGGKFDEALNLTDEKTKEAVVKAFAAFSEFAK